MDELLSIYHYFLQVNLFNSIRVLLLLLFWTLKTKFDTRVELVGPTKALIDNHMMGLKGPG